MKLLAKNLNQKLIPSFISAVKCYREQAGSKFCWTLGPDPAKPYSRLSSIATQACSGRAWRIQFPFSEDLHPAELTCWIYFWMHLLSCCLHKTSFHQPDFTAQRDCWSVFLVKRIYRKEDLGKKKKGKDKTQDKPIKILNWKIFNSLKNLKWVHTVTAGEVFSTQPFWAILCPLFSHVLPYLVLCSTKPLVSQTHFISRDNNLNNLMKQKRSSLEQRKLKQCCSAVFPAIP